MDALLIILSILIVIGLVQKTFEMYYGCNHKANLEETRAFKKEVEELLAGIEEDEKRLMAEEEKKNGGEAKSA